MEKATRGWINGFIGVAIFAGSLPATRVAVADFSPTFLTGARATMAALLGLALLFFQLGGISFHAQPAAQRGVLFWRRLLALDAGGAVAGSPSK